MIIAVMIAKNEAHVLQRCLDSIMPFVNGAYILDTGSDAEQEINMRRIVRALDIKYSKPVHYVTGAEWKGFAESRNDAMKRAIDCFMLEDDDLLFMIDADDYVTEWQKPAGDPSIDGYTVQMQGQNIEYDRTQVFRVGAHWRYFGVVHEFADCPGGNVISLRTKVVSTREGARSQNPNKYLEDAALLATALHKDDTPEFLKRRYRFYLAQSYRDAGVLDSAADSYEERINMAGGWDEEVYCSYLELARINYKLFYSREPQALLGGLAKAQKVCPHRREYVVMMMKAFREVENWQAIIELFAGYPPVDMPKGALFAETHAYTYAMWDEAAIAYHYVGEYTLAVKCATLALAKHPHKGGDIGRIIDNLVLSANALAERVPDEREAQPQDHHRSKRS